METPKKPRKKRNRKELGFEIKVTKKRIKGSSTLQKRPSVLIDPELAIHFSETQLEFIELYIPMHFNATKICAAIGISRGTYDYWVDTNPHFKKVVDSYKDYMVAMAEEVLNKSLENMDTKSAQFILKTLGRKKGYSESLDITSNGQTILPAVITIVNPLSTADDFIKILKPDEETKPE